MLLQVEILFYRGTGREHGRRFGALAQVVGKTAIAFLRKYIVPAAERVVADLVEFAAPEFADVVSGRKSFNTATKILGKLTLREQLGSSSRKKRMKAESFQQNLQNKVNRPRRVVFTNHSH